VPSPVAFRDLTAADIPEGLRLCRQSGWNQTEADWRVLLAPPSVFRGASIDDRLVGTAGAVVYGHQLAWVCMVLVDVAERGHGLATSLVDQVLERLPSGALVGLDATPKGQPVYEKLGFVAGTTLTRLDVTSRAEPAGSPIRARPLADADMPRVLRHDLEVFGADRARVLRAVRASSPEYAWCVENGREVGGYGFGRTGHDADQIGPVVATEIAAARAIVEASMRARPGRRFFVDAYPQPLWRQALAGLGFREQRGFTRMYRGGRSSAPAREEQCLAILGPELG
jgi:GNAT superfamily N-acetyltransferase